MDPTAPDDPPFPADAVEVGFIADAWGVKGWLRVQPHAAEPQALFSSRRWFLRPPDDPRHAPAPRPGTALLPALLRITQAREHSGGVVAQARGIDDRTAAESLKGARVFVSRQSFPTARDDEYYWIDLVGSTVVNRQGETLGTVAGLIDTGAQSVLRVTPDADAAVPAGEAPSERLIPFVAAYVDSVDLAAKRIVVDWGLDY